MPEGPPAGVRYGLCTAAGEPTARARAAAAVARVVHATPTLATAQLVAPYVAIVLSRRTALIAFTSERQIDLYTTAVRGAHRLFFDADIPTRFLHERDIGQQGVPGEIKAVYWPLPSVASPKLAAQLTAFTHRGGTLVAEAGPAQYDPLGWFQPVQPGAGLDALFGAHIIETDVVGRIELTSGSGRIKGEWQLDRLQPHDAEVIATGPDGTPAAVHNRFGKGSAILIGTHPSLAYEKQETRQHERRSFG